MDLVELAPGMGPAGCLIDLVAIKMMKTGIGVRLQGTVEALQVLTWMFAPAILRVSKPDRRSSLFPGRPVIAHIGPQTTGLSLAASGREHRHGRIVSVQLAACKHVLADGVHQRAEQIAGRTHPAGQRGTRDLYPLAGIDL